MKKILISGATLALGLVGAAVFSAPASAAPTGDCRSVTVNLTDRDDTGTGGHVWAKDTMARTLKVCVEAAEPAAPAASESTWKYSATVTDTGTFVTTNAGKSPKGVTGMPAGIKGTVSGGFTSTVFTAPAWTADFKLKAPDAKTSSSDWVKAAFPGSQGATIATYKWTYKSNCGETYIDNNGNYTGDITTKCVTPEKPDYTAPTCKATGVVKLKTTEGVKYTATRNVENGITVFAKVTAEALPNYKLTTEKNPEWIFPVAQLTGDQCKAPTTPPTNNPGNGGGGPTTPPVTPPATTNPAPSTSNAAQLPVTGPGGGTNVPLIAGLTGTALFFLGGALLLWVRRRRDAVEFTA